jgi:hypothetical protein
MAQIGFCFNHQSIGMSHLKEIQDMIELWQVVWSSQATNTINLTDICCRLGKSKCVIHSTPRVIYPVITVNSLELEYLPGTK